MTDLPALPDSPVPPPSTRATRPSGPTGSVRPGRSRTAMFGFGLFVVLSVAIAVAAPTPYLTVGLERMAAADSGLAAHYVDQPAGIRLALLIHAATGGLALLLTPVQASARIRRGRPVVHRVSGRVSAGAIVVAALSGLVVAQVSYAGWSGRIGFSLLSVVWLVAVVRSVTEARAGNLAAHRRWALRVMALTFAAVTLRLWLGLYIGASTPSSDIEAQQAFDQIYAVTPFLSWVPNLLVVEWYLRRRSPRAR